MSWRASDVLLIFDMLFDHRERCDANGADKIAVRRKCWQACSQDLEFLPKHPRCPPLDAPPQPMDTDAHATLGQNQFHIPKAQTKDVIEPDRVLITEKQRGSLLDTSHAELNLSQFSEYLRSIVTLGNAAHGYHSARTLTDRSEEHTSELQSL